MNFRTIRYLLVMLMTFVSSAFSADENPYAKSFSLTIAYQNEGEGSFLVTLKNTSDKKLDLMLDAKELEGTFLVSESEEAKSSFCDKDYWNRLVTSLWFSGRVELEAGAEIKWTVKLDELVSRGVRDGVITKEVIKGQQSH